ncbi:MAG TPA: heme-copper oxidase subunit III [Dermatophilaceae bacterium]|uniref:cytochrome-c oxidase n=1 Tax=Candidatus Phosphoribacter hodrii TaxID=2953743 RepID=A0A935CEI2_9MICO|nr:heme-copper oxidase subunit III [Candidatus Phosphoribacter hodrii]HOA01817.1 heme-copper oxidase subunit III [Dermatophilaceae bacterium]MBL0004592.1 heme-copper oxidase subunit III [Candidatus Phosphoribacter hodrii]HOA58280.1 heme-copper oxidase subunit III [Dermatophilaceae bacterium]HOF36497.1 heme-copper oxidase subunit III [Dermatophilaceae bacterium]
MARVATASAIPAHPVSSGHGPATRPNMVQVGTMVWLSSELMFFAGLFAIYFQLRSVSAELWADQTAKLNVTFATINTAILVISSVWCQIGVMKAERGQASRTGKLTEIGKWGMREWYVVTYLFGATFIAGQVYEYAKLVSENVTLSSDRYGSVFYMATGFHGLHVTGGLIAFLLIIGRTFTTRRYTHTQAVGAVVTSYYWHFVDVVWIALFAVIYLLK